MPHKEILELDPEFGRIVTAGEPWQPKWLVDELIVSDGLTAITGVSKVGKTTLCIDLMSGLLDPRSRGGNLLGKYISGPLRRVMVIATHGQHAQYVRAFADRDDVLIIDVRGRPTPGFWDAYATLARAYSAELVVIDVVQALAGAPTPESLDGLSGFPCSVLGVFTGFAGTPGINGDEYRALAISSIWVQQDKSGGGRTAHVATRWTSDASVPLAQAGPPVPVPRQAAAAPPPAVLDGVHDKVRSTAGLALAFGVGPDPGVALGHLLSVARSAIEAIWGTTGRMPILAAIGANRPLWDAALAGAPYVETGEPPF